MKRRLTYVQKLIVIIIAVTVLMLSGCADSGEGFAVYLTRGDIPPAQMPALSHVEIEEIPVIATDDIVSYDAATHEMSLTASAYERVSRLEVPVRGKSFVVCVNRKPIYYGAFWTPISSQSYDGVIIMKPLISDDAKVIEIGLGYPSPSFYRGEDPRNNAEVMDSLKQAGKLTETP